MWLGSLRTGSQPPEYRIRIQALQREVCKAIAQLFHSIEPAPAAPEMPATPIAPLSTQPDAPPRSAWERLLTAIDESRAALDETKRALVALRQEEQEERARLRGQRGHPCQRSDSRLEAGATRAASSLSAGSAASQLDEPAGSRRYKRAFARWAGGTAAQVDEPAGSRRYGRRAVLPAVRANGLGWLLRAAQLAWFV
jgi:hypothetical protein